MRLEEGDGSVAALLRNHLTFLELRYCMTAIKPDDVKEAVNKILKEI